jgi:hypothetical protein
VTSVTSVIAPAPVPAAQTVPAPADIKKSDAPEQPRPTRAAAAAALERAQTAQTLEAQMAAQATVISSMGYVPGFDAYGQARIQDINAAEMQKKYSQPPQDNRRALWGLSGASEQRWQQIRDQQYQ